MFGSSHDDDGSARGFGLGLLVGAMIGAGAALLLAPASGEDTRAALRKKARRAYREGSERFEELRDNGERVARRYAKQGMRRGREVLNNL
ncbi:MAG: YtxH domain-containing protein [Gemmatimonadaceae bacterium]|jgi:gas vesicle protein|nr:YtxH domain-containing protein [Gemmatimonadaceae bacterium]MCC6433182.1 YtxH domain-containing protein [Gemmatimonadaceae bacterium]